MDTDKNFFHHLSEKCRELLRSKSGITNNEELIAWIAKVPDDILITEYAFPESTLEEIKKSRPYHLAANVEIPFHMGFEKKKKDDPPKTYEWSGGLHKEAIITEDQFSNEILDDINRHGSVEMPDKVDLSGRFGPVRDQGNWGSCVAFAAVAGMESAYNFSHEFSEQFCYYTTKQVDTFPSSQGTRLEFAIKALMKFGICTRETLPYSVEHIMEEPPKNAFNEARRFTYRKHNQHRDGCIVDFIKRMLSGAEYGKELVVAVGVDVFESAWMNEFSILTGKIFNPHPGESPVGGHAMAITGFADNENHLGGGNFIHRCSWGEKYGKDPRFTPPGYGIISYDYIRRFCDEAIVIVEMEEEKEPVVENETQIKSFVVAENDSRPFSRAKSSKLAHEAFLGESGSGKSTFAMKRIASNHGYKHFIMDYHGDYANNENFVAATNAVVWNVLEDGIPFNPLKVPKASHHSGFGSSEVQLNSSGELNKHQKQYIHALRNAFKSCIPSLGSRQASLLEEILTMMAFDVNILGKDDVQMSDMLPTLDQFINDGGERGRIAESLRDQLRPIFNLQILDHQSYVSFDEFIRNNQSIIFLCKIPDDDEMIARKLATSFMVKGIFSHYQKTALGDTHPIVILQDEYHLAPKDLVYENIVREGRKFGVNLWVCSQEIKDVKPLLSNLASCKIFKMANGDQARQVAQAIRWDKKSQHEIIDTIASLKLYEYYDPLAHKFNDSDHKKRETNRQKIVAA